MNQRPATTASAELPAAIVSPPGRLGSIEFKELIRYRHVLDVLLWRNVKMRYRQTLLGPLWFVMTPLIQMAAYSLVLGTLAELPSEGVPYPLFTYSALLVWQLFASGITRSMECLVRYAHIISKVYFPRLLLPAAEVFIALVDFGLSFGILLVMTLSFSFALTPRLLIIPVLLALTMALSLATGLLFAALYARYRDVANVVGYFVKTWFFLTPVVYSESLVTDRVPLMLQWIYRINPMNTVVEGFRWALLGTGRPPDWTLAVTTAITCIFLLFSAMVFRRTEHSIVDLI